MKSGIRNVIVALCVLALSPSFSLPDQGCGKKTDSAKNSKDAKAADAAKTSPASAPSKSEKKEDSASSAAKGPLKITSVQADPETIPSGATAKVEAKISGGGEITYKWEGKNTDTNKDVTNALSSTKGTTTTFTAPDVKQNTDFEIKVTVTRGKDKAEDWAVVTVNPKPVSSSGASGPRPLPTPGGGQPKK